MARISPLYLLAFLPLVMGCSKSNGYVYVDEDEEREKATVLVVGEDGSTSVLQPESVIGIYVIDANGNIVCQRATVDAKGQIVMPDGAVEGQIVIYSPFQNDWGTDEFTNPPLFKVQEDQSAEAGYTASDLLVGTLAKSNTRSSDFRLNFHHMLARMVIHIVDETGGTNLSGISMRLLGMKNSVRVNLLSQSVTTVEDDEADIQMLKYDQTDRRISFSVIVAPQTKDPTEDFIEYNLYGSHKFYSVPQTAELQAGMTYTYQMRLTASGLVPDGTSISNWDGDEDIDAYFNIKTPK